MSIYRTMKGLRVISEMIELSKKPNLTEEEARCVTQFKRGMFVTLLGTFVVISIFLGCFLGGLRLSMFKPDVDYDNIEWAFCKNSDTLYYYTENYIEGEGFEKKFVDISDVECLGNIEKRANIYYKGNNPILVISDSYEKRLESISLSVLSFGFIALIVGCIVIVIVGRKLTEESRSMLERMYNS